MSMRVIGVGFGRTGTESLKAALEMLGFGPCYHMLEIAGQPERAKAWVDLGDPVRPAWDAIFAGYQATVDWPGAAYWRDLVDAYPEAKIILTVRDPEKWYDSATKTVFAAWRFLRSPFAAVLLGAMALRNPAYRYFPVKLNRVIADRVFGGSRFDRDHALATFASHIGEVRRTVPSERLLVFDVAEGWHPLCSFLEVGVPAADFPRKNDKNSFSRRRLTDTFRAIGTALSGLAFAALRFRSRRAAPGTRRN
ncbi:sulfotransferase family protein [Micromonospora haikouensis]|uniref:sulfotransferase family protein n=1 Tax=Micromonospora haikouensis TaxID=686309 RepID=UPI003D747A03